MSSNVGLFFLYIILENIEYGHDIILKKINHNSNNILEKIDYNSEYNIMKDKNHFDTMLEKIGHSLIQY